MGRYDGAHFAEHPGFFPFDDGRVLFVDDQSSTLNIPDVLGPIPGDMQMLASLSGSPLPAMSNTPTGQDASPWESEAFRLTAILPSGDYAVVTHGGDGEISVIDTSSMSIVGTIETPAPLDFGGYLLGMEEGAHASDTLGR